MTHFRSYGELFWNWRLDILSVLQEHSIAIDIDQVDRDWLERCYEAGDTPAETAERLKQLCPRL